jgi:hypothetical protein
MKIKKYYIATNMNDMCMNKDEWVLIKNLYLDEGELIYDCYMVCKDCDMCIELTEYDFAGCFFEEEEPLHFSCN